MHNRDDVIDIFRFGIFQLLFNNDATDNITLVHQHERPLSHRYLL